MNIKKFINKKISNSPDWLQLLYINSRYLIENDEKYRKRIFKQHYGRPLNIEDPVTFNEKIHVRTLKQRNALFTQLADKLAVRDYVTEKIGDEYLIKLYGYYDSVDDIDYDSLPNKFVLKCNHDSGSVTLCHDKNTFNKEIGNKKLSHFLKKNLYKISREWQYKDIKPKIICEEFLDIFPDGNEIKPEDYKFHCFNGKVEYAEIQFDRFGSERKINVYDRDWNLMPFLMGYKNTDFLVEKPCRLDDLVRLAEKLSNGIDYCRVDFYLIKNRIVFGEITFTPCNGLDNFYPESWDYEFGKKWLINK